MHKAMAILLLLCAASNLFAGAIRYTITPLEDLGSGYSEPGTLNKYGQVVGYSFTTTPGVYHAFLYTPGVGIQDLGTLGGTLSQALDVNDSGHVVGVAALPGDTGYHAFLYTPSTGIQDIGATYPGTYSKAFGINNFDQTVGDLGGGGFFYSPSTGMQLAQRGRRINDSGQVAGEDYPGFGTGAGINSRGDVVGIGGAGNAFACLAGGSCALIPGTVHAWAISEDREIIGQAVDSGGTPYAFLSTDGTMSNLTDLVLANPGWWLYDARDINSAGQIVGLGFDPEGNRRGFLLNPVPEPRTLGLFGLLAVFALRKRHTTHTR